MVGKFHCQADGLEWMSTVSLPASVPAPHGEDDGQSGGRQDQAQAVAFEQPGLVSARGPAVVAEGIGAAM